MSQALLPAAISPVPAAAAARSKAWIISPVWDVLLLIAAPLAIVPLVSQAAAHWVDVERIAVVVVAFASLGHHLPGYLRAYGDRELFARFRQRFLLAPPAVFALALLCVRENLHALSLILLFWATWHGLMQTYGFMRIYDLKQGSGDRRSAQLDFLLCLMFFGAGLLFSDGRVYGIADTMVKSGLTIPSRAALLAARWVTAGVMGLVAIAYAADLVGRFRRGQPLAWPRLAVAFSTGWLYWLGGMISTDLVVGVATFEIFHALQYDAIAWAYNRGRSRKSGALARPLGALFQMNRWASLPLYIGLILAFGAVRMLGDGGGSSTLEQTLLALLMTSTFLHYYYDGFIWKVREPEVRQDLAIGTQAIATQPIAAQANSAGRRGWRWNHAAGWAVLVLLAGGLLLGESFKSPTSAAEERQLAQLTALVPELPELQWRVSQAAIAAGDREAAVAAARLALERRPHAQRAHFQLGVALLESDRCAEAAEQFAEAARIAPRLWQNQCNLGVALSRSDRYDEAEAAFQRADALRPHDALVQAAWGRMCARRGDLAGAIAHDRQALAADPADFEVRGQLVALLSQTGEHEAAIANARQGAELQPTQPAVWLALGEALQQAGRDEEAVAALEQSLSLDAESALANFQLGNVYLARNDSTAAAAHYRRCLDLQPDFVAAYVNLASALMLEGNLPGARRAYERALSLDPDNRGAHYNFGLLLLNSGEQAAALAHLARARELGAELPLEVEQMIEGPKASAGW